jgi:cytochrome c oxidase assembly factor CtaG
MTAALVAIGPAAALYALGVARGRRWDWRAAAAWALGLAVLGIALTPAMDRAADRELSMHMVQHGLIGMVVAPLLVAGAPVRVALAAVPPATGRRLTTVLHRLRAFAHPAVGTAAFVAVLAVVHVPAVYDLSLRAPAVHGVVHAALLWSALLLWLPLLAADPLPHRASPAATVAALIIAMAAMAALGAAIAAQQQVLYAPYAGRTPDALADQRLAGGVMSLGGMVVVLPALLILAWRALVAEERRAVARERRGLIAGGGSR